MTTPPPKRYRTAKTRTGTLQISGHFATEPAKAFKIMAESQDKDMQEMMAEAFNMAFERFGFPNRISIVSGRRKRPRPTPEPS